MKVRWLLINIQKCEYEMSSSDRDNLFFVWLIDLYCAILPGHLQSWSSKCDASVSPACSSPWSSLCQYQEECATAAGAHPIWVHGIKRWKKINIFVHMWLVISFCGHVYILSWLQFWNYKIGPLLSVQLFSFDISEWNQLLRNTMICSPTLTCQIYQITPD